MKKIRSFKQNWLTCTIFMVIVSLGALVFGNNFYYSLDAFNKKLSLLLLNKIQALEELKDFHAIYLDKEKFSQYEENHMKKLDFVRKKLPQEMQTENFLHDLAPVAVDSKVEILETQIKDAIKDDIYQKQIIKIRCSGDFFALQVFFHALEQEMQFLEIKNLKIEHIEQDQGAHEELLAEMEIILYAHAS